MLQRIIFSIALVGSFQLAAAGNSAESKSLTEQLRERAEASQKKSPAKRRKVMNDAIEDLRRKKVVEQALKTGDKMPSFELPDATGKAVSTEKLLSQGPLVVVFYRGGWCPYCNLQLRDLQKHLPEIRKSGASLVAISPQNPDNSLSTAKKENLDFYVLSDVGNKVANKFGLVFKLPPDLKKVYQNFGIDLEKANSSKKWELPLSATYIVDKTGKVAFSFVDVDYKKRAETRDIIKFLKKNYQS